MTEAMAILLKRYYRACNFLEYWYESPSLLAKLRYDRQISEQFRSFAWQLDLPGAYFDSLEDLLKAIEGKEDDLYKEGQLYGRTHRKSPEVFRRVRS